MFVKLDKKIINFSGCDEICWRAIHLKDEDPKNGILTITHRVPKQSEELDIEGQFLKSETFTRETDYKCTKKQYIKLLKSLNVVDLD